MDLDKDKIKQRFAEINEAVASAKELPLSDDNEFWNRKSNIAALKYYLLQAIEAVGGVCVHVAAKKLNKGVSGFGECFELLGEEKILKIGFEKSNNSEQILCNYLRALLLEQADTTLAAASNSPSLESFLRLFECYKLCFILQY